MRKLAVLTLLAAAVVVAADKTPEELIERLGHADYQVREDATKALMALGQAAVPALEKALQSEDVEVRMRAGRALRTIRARKPAPKPKVAPAAPGMRSVRIRMQDGEYVVSITTVGADRKPVTKTYRGKTLDEIEKKHPEVREALRGMHLGPSRARGPSADPFRDFDKWFEDGWGRRDNDDSRNDFWRKADSDLNEEIARLRKWARTLAEQQRRHQGANGARRRNSQAEALAGVRLLGVRASRPAAVLDAQLELRGKGIVVEEVGRGTLAARLGLKRFDILLELNAMPVRGLEDIGPALRSREQGQPVGAKVMRRGASVELKSEEPSRKAPSPR